MTSKCDFTLVLFSIRYLENSFSIQFQISFSFLLNSLNSIHVFSILISWIDSKNLPNTCISEISLIFWQKSNTSLTIKSVTFLQSSKYSRRSIFPFFKNWDISSSQKYLFKNEITGLSCFFQSEITLRLLNPKNLELVLIVIFLIINPFLWKLLVITV